jgi:hypothetical protein
VTCDLEWNDDWRLGTRVAHEADAVIGWPGQLREASATVVDLGEGGLSFLTEVQPKVGDRLRVGLNGFWIEAVVRNVCKDGRRFRVGVEQR